MRRSASKLAVYFGLINDEAPGAEPASSLRPMTRRARAWAFITSIASLCTATFLIWDLIDEDAVPHALLIPVLIAVVITIVDAVARILSERRRPGESS